MNKRQIEKSIKLKDIESLLSQQTVVILSAVDEKLCKFKERINIKK